MKHESKYFRLKLIN